MASRRSRLWSNRSRARLWPLCSADSAGAKAEAGTGADASTGKKQREERKAGLAEGGQAFERLEKLRI